MSVARIKEEILHLTPADRQEVEAFLRALTQGEQKSETAAPESSRRQRFEEAKSHLFSQYGELLEKLAK